jgi:hypothetical protein
LTDAFLCFILLFVFRILIVRRASQSQAGHSWRELFEPAPLRKRIQPLVGTRQTLNQSATEFGSSPGAQVASPAIQFFTKEF